jgi:alpha-2-macroglobulin
MRSEMALSSQIQLLHAMGTLRLPLSDLKQGLAIILPRVTVGPAEARVETEDAALSELLESKARSTAMLLEAVLEMDAQNPLAPKLARGLLAMRTGASYRSTQEDAWALLAFEKYRANEQLPTKRLGIEVSWGDELVGSHDLGGGLPRTDSTRVTAKKLLQNPNSLLTLALQTEGQVNYSVDLKLAKDGASKKALDQGFSVEKLVRALEPNELKEAAKVIPERSSSEATLGNLVLVDLLLESAESRDWIVIDDPMPAGFEPVEFGFDTTAQALAMAERTDTRQMAQPDSGPYYGNRTRLDQVHREMHDDRVHYFIPHVGPGIYHLRYLARATAAGNFVVPPTRASCMYDPEIFGQTKSTRFDIAIPK